MTRPGRPLGLSINSVNSVEWKENARRLQTIHKLLQDLITFCSPIYVDDVTKPVIINTKKETISLIPDETKCFKCGGRVYGSSDRTYYYCGKFLCPNCFKAICPARILKLPVSLIYYFNNLHLFMDDNTFRNSVDLRRIWKRILTSLSVHPLPINTGCELSPELHETTGMAVKLLKLAK